MPFNISKLREQLFGPHAAASINEQAADLRALQEKQLATVAQRSVGGMGPRDFFIGIVFVLALGLGVTMTTSAHAGAEFWFARVCYLIAAAALGLGFKAWLQEARRPLPVVMSVGAVVILLVVGGMPSAILWTNYREHSMTPAPGALQASSLVAARPRAAAINAGRPNGPSATTQGVGPASAAVTKRSTHSSSTGANAVRSDELSGAELRQEALGLAEEMRQSEKKFEVAERTAIPDEPPPNLTPAQQAAFDNQRNVASTALYFRETETFGAQFKDRARNVLAKMVFRIDVTKHPIPIICGEHTGYMLNTGELSGTHPLSKIASCIDTLALMVPTGEDTGHAKVQPSVANSNEAAPVAKFAAFARAGRALERELPADGQPSAQWQARYAAWGSTVLAYIRPLSIGYAQQFNPQLQVPPGGNETRARLQAQLLALDAIQAELMATQP